MGFRIGFWTDKKVYDKQFEKGKQTVVITLSGKEDLETCLESAKEHGYRMIHKNSIVLGVASELIFEKIVKSGKS